MVKRKAVAASDSEDGSDASVQASPPPSKKTSAKKPKITISDEEDESGSEDEKPLKKPQSKAKGKSKSKAAEVEASSDDEVTVHKSSEGEKYVDLGKKKRATVRSFKGMALIDIREFWGEGGSEKPGKKGISLNAEQALGNVEEKYAHY
ncbi:hypothetical protein VNI00_003923 [Paramarasmius palmivorus]|uniref:Transcriptional coactivator p15 (PC4) C-terminal domain-containing protein n=1 Tax=Paramarasmius palmivorus TaxID=297713 RepID=A0AAW0DKM5_9AGAR